MLNEVFKIYGEAGLEKIQGVKSRDELIIILGSLSLLAQEMPSPLGNLENA